MARNKARDDKFFNCVQEFEDDYVSSHYDTNKGTVKSFLKDSCKTSVINYSTHESVYKLIEEKLGYPVPSSPK
jgi:hypothetical protein